MQVKHSETLTETERNTVYVTVHGYEFRLWWNTITCASTPHWQVDVRETDGEWSYYAYDYSLPEAFNHVRRAVDL